MSHNAAGDNWDPSESPATENSAMSSTRRLAPEDHSPSAFDSGSNANSESNRRADSERAESKNLIGKSPSAKLASGNRLQGKVNEGQPARDSQKTPSASAKNSTVSDDQRQEWVMKACKGDRRAFTSLVQSHRRLALSVSYGVLGEEHWAADAVQDAFLKAFQAIDRLKDPQRFVGWFAAIVRTSALDLLRKRGRWGREIPMHETDLGDFQSASSAAKDRGSKKQGNEGKLLPNAVEWNAGGSIGVHGIEGLEQEEKSEKIRRAVASLDSESREILNLKHLVGLSYKEIARLQNTSARSVESKLFRARQQLQKILGDEI